jgi:hypothetical protein
MRYLIILPLLILVGCAAPQPPRLVADQYCFTSKTVETDSDSTVSSKTTVKCSDDPIEHYAPARMGLSKDCFVSHIPVSRGGHTVQEKIYVCRKINGRFDIVEPVRIR